MRKICFFMETPFTLGGEQRVVTILSNMLVNKGFDVTILCTNTRVIRDNSLYGLNQKVNIDYLNGYNNRLISKTREIRDNMYFDNLKSGKYKNSLLIQKFINCDLITTLLLKRKIDKEKYDVVIGLGNYNRILVRVSNYVKAKVYGWQHSSSERYFETEGEWFYNFDKFTKYMFNKFDKYIVLTNEDKKYIKDKFNKDVIVINNPKSIKSDVTTDLKNKYFLAVGRFVQVKNFSLLIDLFNEYHKKNKEWKLRIVGEGPLREEYINKINKYNLNDCIEIVKFTKNIEKYYLESSIYLMTSKQEGWGMVMSEAIEFGLPIISFNITSASEMINNGENGYIIEKYNIDEYINKMLELSNNKDKLKSFSKKSRAISLSKNDEIIVKKWIDIINE